MLLGYNHFVCGLRGVLFVCFVFVVAMRSCCFGGCWFYGCAWTLLVCGCGVCFAWLFVFSVGSGDCC